MEANNEEYDESMVTSSMQQLMKTGGRICDK